MVENEKVGKDGKIQLLLRVTPQVKQLAEEEAHLAYLYGWISKPSMTHLLTWLVEDYLATGVRDFITRRKIVQRKSRIVIRKRRCRVSKDDIVRVYVKH